MFNKNRTNQKRIVKNTVLKVPFKTPSGVSNDICNEIMDVIETTKFDKISIPLSSYRRYYDSRIDEKDTKIFVIGYIRKFNKEDNTFTVVIFNNNTKTVTEFANPEITVGFTQFKDKLGAITKFIIAPGVEVDDDSDTETTIDTVDDGTPEMGGSETLTDIAIAYNTAKEATDE